MKIEEITDRRVVVMGLGRFGGGIAVARWLAERGARITVTDLASREDLCDSVAQLSDLPIAFHLGGHDTSDLDHCDLLVVSPAVPKDRSDFVARAVARGIPITSEMNLFVEFCPARRVVGVTGSAGKSTTTAMVGAILTAAADKGDLPKVWIGGNIGQSLLNHLEDMKSEDIVVLELSSFQLEDLAALKWSPSHAVITNIKPNHLDRHGNLAAYVDAKMNIVRYQSSDDMVFVHQNDTDLARKVERVGASSQIIPYGWDPLFTGVLRVPGRHNVDNAAAAAAVARSLSVADEIIKKALASFTGLPHRLEFVVEHNGVRYYNDSKSTTPDSTVIALEAFDCPVVVMIGGRDKGMPFDDLTEKLADRAKAIICYGQTGRRLFDMVSKHSDGASQTARVELADGFEQAVTRAHALAEPGNVVVLSPACTSYDMFSNYEQRGDAFRQIVCELVR
ncbi:MAG: UDP-N-acetylmuramoyl-L-alanine--D-glutamate ligase [Planctomycetota bacterium]|nr:MAG: UDP-N-acetylmuramoyl-L-alanine--D-glutamate ligase [Planctomycetota bacterium]